MNSKINAANRRQGGFLKRYAELLGLSFRFIDLLAVIAGAYCAHLLRFGSLHLDTPHFVVVIFTLLAIFIIFPLFSVYKPWRTDHLARELEAVAGAWLAVLACGALILYLTKTGEAYSRLWIAYWWVMSLAFFVLFRLGLRGTLWWLRKKGYNKRYVLILGAGELGRIVLGEIRRSRWTGMEVMAFLDDDESLHGTEIDGVPVLGSLDEVKQLTSSSRAVIGDAGFNAQTLNRIDQVWVTLPLACEQRIKQVCRVLDNTTASVRFVPDIFTYSLLNHSIDELGGIPIINLSGSSVVGGAELIKRAEDICVSLIAIVVTAPIMLCIALMIRLETPGPALFKQRRYGIDGREITVWKFRTMRVREDGEHIPQATRNDPRVTRIGAVLRKFSLDELPQFFNVLMGRMSVVGPRPHAVVHNEEYRQIVDKYMWRHKVKPGITGWAQINGWRGETDKPEKMEKRVSFDLEYIDNWSLWLDIKIILKTLFVGFVNKRAY